jgi:glutamine synthetase
MGDWMMYYKYITKNVARRHNKTVTFMPKPLFGDNGSGMHTHQSIWKAGTTNSYKRLVPGYEAPVNFAYSARNRSAAIRIPTYSPSPKAKRVEFRPPDPAANIYLACSALLLAGLDGIQNRIDPGDPLDKNLYDLPPEELAKVPQAPDSLEGAIKALEADHDFLLKGDVFTMDFIENWIELKRKECDALRLRPHPYEFAMYFDV